MINTVIFDLDGTLINSLEDICDGVNFALRQQGYKERTIEEVRMFIGDGADMLIKRAVPENTSEEDFFKTYHIYKAYYDKHSRVKTMPYEGINELLTVLKQNGINIGINTNKPDFVANLITKDFFEGVFTVGADLEKRRKKPYPDGVEAIMERFGVKRENCIYVGDTRVDVKTAKNSNIRSIGVLWGFRDYEDLKEADYIAEKPCEIADIIDKLNV